MNELIQWPRAKYWDKAWNPIVGCRAVSPACENCWAREWMGRFPQYGGSFEPRATKAGGPPRKGVVFCGNMTDLFGEWRNPGDMAKDIFLAMQVDPAKRRQATYLWLTKRTGRMMRALQFARELTFSPDRELSDLYSNQYFGFTAEDQTHYAERLLPVYAQREDWMRCWVSCEPLLGPVNLRLGSELICGCLSWVVVGCESGPRRRPCKLEWVERIVFQCIDHGVPVFVKQLDLGGKCVTDITRFPEHLRVRQVPWAK